MEAFPRYGLFVRGIYRSPLNSPHEGQWVGASMFSLIYTWIDGWENNRQAGDLRRNCSHYNVTVICFVIPFTCYRYHNCKTIVCPSQFHFWVLCWCKRGPKGIMFALVTILCVPAGLIDFLGIVAGHVYLRDELNRIAETESYVAFNLLRPRLNRRPFAGDIFKCIFLNEN